MCIKRLISVILACVFFCLCVSSVGASDVVSEGKCGPSVSYTVYSDGTMVLEGTGTVRQGSFDKEIKSLIVSEGITSIGNYVFSSCAYLEKVSLPDSLVSVGEMSFYSSGLKEVHIPKNVSKIGDMAFSDCDNLKKITVHHENESFSAENGVLFNKEKSVLISFPAGLNGSYTVIDTVSEIAASSFYSSKLTEVIFKDSLLTIGEEAFARSGLKKVVIPENVLEIKGKAFENCSSLSAVEIKSKNVSIGDFAFYYCANLKKVDMGEGVSYIGEYAFSDCPSLEYVLFSETLEEVGSFAFYNCDSIERIRIPQNVKSLGKRAFSNCDNLLRVIVCSENLEICEKAFGFNDNIRLRDTVVYGVSGSTAEEYSLYTFKFVDISTSELVFTSEKLFVSDEYVMGIEEKTDASQFSLLIANNGVSVSEKNANVSTGLELSIGEKTYIFVILGDTDGNGLVNSTDYLQIKKAFLGEYSLENEYFKAADTDGDGMLTSTDYLKIKNHFLGTKSLYLHN